MMADHLMGRLKYNIGFVGGSSGFKLKERDRIKLSKCFPSGPPTDELIQSIERVIGFSVNYARAMENSTPAKVRDRLLGVRERALSLFNALSALEENDLVMLNQLANIKFLNGEEHIRPDQLRSFLYEFIEGADYALTDVENSGSRGRMPALAEHSLAHYLCADLIRHGYTPAQTRGGLFDKVLRFSLSILDVELGRALRMHGEGRRDVMELMKYALQQSREG